MAVTSVGYDGSLTEGQFSRVMWALGKVSAEHGVTLNLNTTVGAGTRGIQVSAGQGVACGVLADSGAVETFNLDANANATTRIDYVVMRFNWADNVTSIAVIKGQSSGAVPALTQTAGTLWEMPLARVAVRSGVTVIEASDITICKPLPRVPRLFSGSITLVDISHSAAAAVAASVDVTDPGWPYRLVINAEIRLAASTGFGLLYAFADSTEIGRSWTPRLDIGGSVPATLAKTSAALSGPLTAQLRVQASGMTSGDRLTIVNSAQALSYTVLQVPA